MSRKTVKTSLAAIVASIVSIMAIADGSGAVAQATEQGPNADPKQVILTDEIVPETASTEQPSFISAEVVQDIPDQPAPAPIGSLTQLVAETAIPDRMSEQMHCLAGAIYFESRGEPLAGQLAVAQVIINRTESRRFPSSYCGVVYQPAQFSFVRNGAMPTIRTSSGAWRKAQAIARIAHEGMWDSEAGDSLYFHAHYVKPKWARTKLARATISSHIFYR